MKTTKEMNQKGITMIALVITIIVMLILVSVTIATAVNGGLFDYAKKAVDETKNAIDKEQELANGKIEVEGKWYNSIEDYINNKPIEKYFSIEETLNLEIENGYDVTTSTPITSKLQVQMNDMEGTINWVSDNLSVATVNQEGLVTAVGTGTAKITASITFEGKTYTAECTVTVKLAPVTALEISKNLKAYLGKEVDYGVTYSDESVAKDSKWEIFYADENHVYIITKGCTYGNLSWGASTGTGDFTEENLKSKYPAVAEGLFYKTYDPSKTPALQYAGLDTDGNSYPNMQMVVWLLDSTKWTAFLDSRGLAAWAIGAPTMELFTASQGSKVSTPSGTGYSDSYSVGQGSYLNHYTSGSGEPDSYWIAAPSDNGGSILCCVNGSYGMRRKTYEYAEMELDRISDQLCV